MQLLPRTGRRSACSTTLSTRRSENQEDLLGTVTATCLQHDQEQNNNTRSTENANAWALFYFQNNWACRSLSLDISSLPEVKFSSVSSCYVTSHLRQQAESLLKLYIYGEHASHIKILCFTCRAWHCKQLKWCDCMQQATPSIVTLDAWHNKKKTLEYEHYIQLSSQSESQCTKWLQQRLGKIGKKTRKVFGYGGRQYHSAKSEKNTFSGKTPYQENTTSSGLGGMVHSTCTCTMDIWFWRGDDSSRGRSVCPWKTT